ncbi:Stp1/IreP family PP2C-type Ser/Thr phosphatase [Oxalobacteraceae bacterium OM1]|nr:Stp1/IreP family PP2C-type Ser/Thr phosphatase [Oxalobacteraceae bacterium OM1]
MSRKPRLEFACSTDTGMVRPQNEDAIAVSPVYDFAILADGMGGYNAGEVASGMAVEVIRQYLETALGRRRRLGLPLRRGSDMRSLIAEATERANDAVYAAAQSEAAYNGMGTTLVVAAFEKDRVMLAHIGDSRAYRLRAGRLDQLTRDHSVLQEQLDAGIMTPEDARLSVHRNLVTRALGVVPEVEADLVEYETMPGDVYLLCSDGLSDMLDDEDIAVILAEEGCSLTAIGEALIAAANEAGGRDNVSVVLARVTGDRPKGLLAKLLP